MISLGGQRWKKRSTDTKNRIARSLVCYTRRIRCPTGEGQLWVCIAWYIPARVFGSATDEPVDLFAVMAANYAICTDGAG